MRTLLALGLTALAVLLYYFWFDSFSYLRMGEPGPLGWLAVLTVLGALTTALSCAMSSDNGWNPVSVGVFLFIAFVLLMLEYAYNFCPWLF